MSDAYSAYCDEQNRKFREEAETRRQIGKKLAKNEIKKRSNLLKESKLSCVKCCGTCEHFRSYSKTCSKMLVKKLDELNICRYWKKSVTINTAKSASVDIDLCIDCIM